MYCEAARTPYKKGEEKHKKPDAYFCELVEKHFGETDIGDKVDKYLRDHDDVASDSSIVYHVFNAIRSTRFAGSFRQTWERAMSLASKFFPTTTNVEKFVIASLLKFAIAVRKDVLEGRGRDYWQKEMEESLVTMEDADNEAATKAEIWSVFSYALSARH